MIKTPIRFRLIIPHNLCHRAFAELKVGNRLMAWGRIQRSYHSGYCDLIVHRLLYSEFPPSGQEQSPLFDWILFDAPQANDSHKARDHYVRRINQSAPRQGQLLAYLQLGRGSEENEWTAFVFENGEYSPIESIHLVGPGMNVYRRSPESGLETARDQSADRDSKWSRLAGAIGPETFSAYRDTRVLLIGAGRTGSALASTLLRSGLRDLTIVDSDVLEPHNRDMTVGNTDDDIGRPKVEVLSEHLHAIRPDAVIRGIAQHVQNYRVVHHFRTCALVISCVDNDGARAYISRLAARLMLVHLDIGTSVRNVPARQGNVETGKIISADIRLILPESCLNCVGGLNTDQPAPDAMDRPSQESQWQQDGRAGSLPSINHIAVGIAYQMWLDLVGSRITDSHWQRVEWVAGEGLRVTSGQISGNPQCSVCSFRASEFTM